MRKLSILFILTLMLTTASVGLASAQGPASLDLPPGIAAQAQPLIEAMMARMQENGMSHGDMSMMMTHMQTMVDTLPPGIFLKILKLASELDMHEMMTLHQAMHQGDLLQQPPGQILKFVKDLAR